jgi:hypothetical protein
VTNTSEELKQQIRALFFVVGLSDKEILTCLESEGISITPYNLKVDRKQMGLYRRLRETDDREEADAVTREIIQAELARGPASGFGQGFLFTFLRQRGYNISRDRAFRALRTVAPEIVERRRQDVADLGSLVMRIRSITMWL